MRECIVHYQDGRTSAVSWVCFPIKEKKAQPRMGGSLRTKDELECGPDAISYPGLVSSDNPCIVLDATLASLVARNCRHWQGCHGHSAGRSWQKAFRIQLPRLGACIEDLNCVQFWAVVVLWSLPGVKVEQGLVLWWVLLCERICQSHRLESWVTPHTSDKSNMTQKWPQAHWLFNGSLECRHCQSLACLQKESENTVSCKQV